MGETEQKKRGFFDWATKAIAPLGIFAGPLSIASMFSHLITWHGPLGYLVNFWKEEIRQPFRNGIDWIAQLLDHWVHIPKPPDLLVDYIVLSLLLTSSYLRATYMVPKNSVRHTILNSAMYLLFWPIVTANVIVSVAREGVKSWPRLALNFSSFIGFFILWAGNEAPKLWALIHPITGH